LSFQIEEVLEADNMP